MTYVLKCPNSSPPTQLVDGSYSTYEWLRQAPSQIPPTQLVDGSYSTYEVTQAGSVPNPTNAVGGWFILNLRGDSGRLRPKSHQRSWWMVHTQPTEPVHPPESHQWVGGIFGKRYSAVPRQAEYEPSTNCVGGIARKADRKSVV